MENKILPVGVYLKRSAEALLSNLDPQLFKYDDLIRGWRSIGDCSPWMQVMLRS